ncbi:hypothetical protein N5853_08050 [Bartonella sp. HY329]|uniref:hypothetical protein n=1 Tax=unclassified Bartonella TaxID=2645622 RepID=UPI0021C9E13D|nr:MULTISPECIES: hypothetical protein [unclassified Bartonella]UXM94071.1 hypothetical protein N5853_08050 [Bartonella sp. HY329]UXN08393.1 hypothetical protein N5852_08060 [Bartonella sp. HY328]
MQRLIVLMHRLRSAAKKERLDAHRLGCSKGGLTSKIQLVGNVLGTPLRIIVTPGNRNAITQVKEFFRGFKANFLLADKGNDGQHHLDMASAAQAIPVVAQRLSANWCRYLDRHI